jgi:hypothetical protein
VKHALALNNVLLDVRVFAINSILAGDFEVCNFIKRISRKKILKLKYTLKF